MKSPVASLCFACSSVKKRVSVTISVLTLSLWIGTPFVAMMKVCDEDFGNENRLGKQDG